jgi:hypothetical protein
VERIPSYFSASCKAQVTEVAFDTNSVCAEIGLYAFESCSKLTTISLPSSLTSIKRGAFKNCSNLSVITIPENIKTIGNEAFLGTKKDTINFNATEMADLQADNNIFGENEGAEATTGSAIIIGS